MPSKALVVDTNILIRAVLGNRARALIEAYGEDASFFVPEPAYLEAEEHWGLANRLGVKTQQIQRYEATEYESASFARVLKVVQALGLRSCDEIAPVTAP